ncbi:MULTISPECIES: hypothetical protein [Sphingomonas]|nr:hypothetical protein [Sphingomonas pituitosa]
MIIADERLWEDAEDYSDAFTEAWSDGMFSIVSRTSSGFAGTLRKLD